MTTTAEKMYTYEKDFKEFVQALHTGATLQIDEEMFYYWLEVLPPVYMHKNQMIDGEQTFCQFGFAEGREYITDFWKRDGKIYCKQSNRMNPWG